MDKVFIVTRGEYSDYGIVCVFSDEKMAVEFVERRNSSGGFRSTYQVEEYTINTETIPDVTLVVMDEDGNVLRTGMVEVAGESGLGKSEYMRFAENATCEFHWVWVAKDTYTLAMFSYALTSDKDRAIKIANERRTAIIATDRWPSSDEGYKPGEPIQVTLN